MTTETPITAVLIGSHRSTADKQDESFAGTPYKVVAILDMSESLEGLQYSAQNLAILLNALHPPPRILITGTAVPDSKLPDIQTIWNDFTRRWQVDGIWVAMSKTHPSPGGPPPPGALEHVMKTLDDKFLN